MSFSVIGTMTDVPEEEEEECEVWSSRTDPVPEIPPGILKQPTQDEEDEAEDQDDGVWDPEDYAGIPKPPDGGWGWVIVAASFFCNMVVDGIAYSFGIFLIHFVKYYNSAKGETAWVGSLLSGCYLSAGPLVSALTNKFGCRPVTIAGSLVSSAAFLLSTVAPNVRVLMFTYGIMGGIGFGLIYLPAIVSVGYYFSTKRAFATGIAVCGSGMGAFVFAPITQYLLDVYDWRGALMILAGFALNCVVFGALMRPLKADNSRGPSQETEVTTDAEKMSVANREYADSGLVLIAEEPSGDTPLINTEPGVQSTLNINEVVAKLSQLPTLAPHLTDELHNSVDTVPVVEASQQLSTATKYLPVPEQDMQNSSTGALKEASTPVRANGAIKPSRSQVNMKDFQRRFTMPAVLPVSDNLLCPTSNNNYLVQRSSVGRDVSWSVQGGPSRRRRIQDRRDLARPLYRKDIFYSGSIAYLPEFQNSKNDVRSYVASVTSIPCSRRTSVAVTSEKKKKTCSSSCLSLPKSMVDTLTEVLDFSLLKYPPFLLTCIANVVGMMGFYIPFVYLTDSSVMKGIDRDSAAFLISILGITNLVGRLVFGWVVDRPRVRALDVNNLCLTIGGIATFVVPFCYSYTAIVVASSIFSFFVSAYISLTSIILVDMVGLDKLTNSFGLLSLFRGAASIVGPPMAGSVFDVTGSYDIPFYMAGALLVTSAAITFFIPWITRCNTKKDLQNRAEVAKDLHRLSHCSNDTDNGKPPIIMTSEHKSAV